MSRRNAPLFLAVILVLGAFLASAPAAHAQMASQDIRDGLQNFTDQMSNETQIYVTKVEKAVKDGTTAKNNTLIQIEKDRLQRDKTPAIDYALFFSMVGVPVATATTSMLASSAMESRYRELNLIKQNTTQALAVGLIDSTTGSLSNDPQNFQVYMDYFCDPLSQDGAMGLTKTKCGAKRIAALGDPGTDPYAAAAGTDSAKQKVAVQNLQIIGLPLRPSALFFEPMTYATAPTTTGGADQPNTNNMAGLIYPAVMYFERLVLGKPQNANNSVDLTKGTSIESYLAKQGKITRQMLAAYPFSMLFAERVGTMINTPPVAGSPFALPSPPAAAARLVRNNYASATMDPTVLAYVKTLESQPSMSLAQYLDIIAYKLPMSPGYLSRINNLTPTQLQREKLFLMGVQNVLKYQTNRWMEVSVALEAVGK